jgi:hypothetical protein
MLLQTNSYIVPRDKRMEHARLLRRFRQTLLRLGCDHFEVYEQVGANWNTGETTGRFVQILRFHDRKHQLEVQGAERTDPIAQNLVKEFCELINFPYQQQQGLFAVGFYTSFLRMPPQRTTTATSVESEDQSGAGGRYNAGESHSDGSSDVHDGPSMMISPEPGVVQRGTGDRQPNFVDQDAVRAVGADVTDEESLPGEETISSADSSVEESARVGESHAPAGEMPVGDDVSDLLDEHDDQPMTAEEIARVQAELASDGEISLEPVNLDGLDEHSKSDR